jgi:glycosyltransferase involved in cell wall biosynthesis
MDLFVFANFGKLTELPKSGGQTSARRVMAGLEGLGYKVHPIIKHRSVLKGKAIHQIEVITFAIIDFLKIFSKLILKRRKESVFMMLTYAGSLVPFEFVNTCMARCLGFKCIYYLKGGKLLDTYESGGRLHKWMFKQIMDMQSLVLFEGMDSLKIVRDISQTPLAYFPNYVPDNLIEQYEKKVGSPIGILYFGRVTPSKNVHVCIDTFQLLAKKYPHIHLTIIGDSTRAIDYTNHIAQIIEASPYSDRIRKMGNSPFEVIQKVMKTHHFFLFPSHEMAEGHSNSLTEAMAQGLIPIVSDWHFNHAIVGDDRLVVKGYAPIDYSSKIEEIIENGDIEKLSFYSYQRVKNNYIESLVLQHIHEVIERTLS